MRYEIIDFHAHVFPDDIAHKAVEHLGRYYKCPVPEDGTFDSLIKSMEKGGVGQCVLLSSATHPRQVKSVNNYIASLTKRGFIGFGTVHPEQEDIEGEVLRIKALGLRGIKLHPEFQGFAIDSNEAYEIYKHAEGVLPVLTHMGDVNSDLSSPKRLKRVLEDFPRLTVIAAHLGGYAMWGEAEEYLVGRAGLFLDTSSALPYMEKEQAIRIIKNHGAENCIFGTDFPLASHKTAIEQFLGLGLSDEENALIFSENAKRLLSL